MVNRTISFRVPNEILKVLETQVELTGRSKSSLIVEALTQSLEAPQASPEAITITSLQHQLKALEKKVAVLSSQLAEVRLKARLSASSLRNSKLLDKAVVSFQSLGPAAANVRED